mmetsp:Transcript_13004/g.28698  ORF Transcript_13004/g.28698 Transcript_13004/m.28698 type:complete len:142 (-) Transcript_13004:732-1157(-)
MYLSCTQHVCAPLHITCVQNFHKQLKEAIEKVGEYVDLHQVFSTTFESGILADRSVHEALHSCRREAGWSIGLSVSSSRQDDVIREAMKITTADAVRLFDSVQCTYYLLEQRAGNALLEAHEAGMNIIVKLNFSIVVYQGS